MLMTQHPAEEVISMFTSCTTAFACKHEVTQSCMLKVTAKTLRPQALGQENNGGLSMQTRSAWMHHGHMHPGD